MLPAIKEFRNAKTLVERDEALTVLYCYATEVESTY